MVDWDYKGPFVTSMVQNEWLLTSIDAYDGCPWVEVYPVQNKDQCGKRLIRYCKTVGVPDRIRSDNAPEFKADESTWRKAYNALKCW